MHICGLLSNTLIHQLQIWVYFTIKGCSIKTETLSETFVIKNYQHFRHIWSSHPVICNAMAGFKRSRFPVMVCSKLTSDASRMSIQIMRGHSTVHDMLAQANYPEKVSKKEKIDKRGFIAWKCWGQSSNHVVKSPQPQSFKPRSSTPGGDRHAHTLTFLYEIQFSITFTWTIFLYNR